MVFIHPVRRTRWGVGVEGAYGSSLSCSSASSFLSLDDWSSSPKSWSREADCSNDKEGLASARIYEGSSSSCIQRGRNVGGRSSSSSASCIHWRGSYICNVSCEASSSSDGSSYVLDMLVREETLRAWMERSVPVVADAEREGSGE